MTTTTTTAAAASVPEMAKKEPQRIHLTNLQMRSLTICIVGPAVIAFGAYSEKFATILAIFATFMCGIEWSGLKRHLKVALLMSLDNVPPLPLQTSVPSSSTLPRDFVVRPPPPSPCVDGVLLCPEEYATPVVPVSLYNIVKHLCWALLALAAYSGEEEFIMIFAFYFLAFVVITLTAHNRLELKVEKAIQHLSEQFGATSQGTSPRSAEQDVDKQDLSRFLSDASTDPTLSREARVAIAQRNYFLSMELHMFAERQPTEQFLDFCLDIFGILWLSGLVTPIFTYRIPNVGLPWLASTLIGNFCNDIAALVMGRSLRALRNSYGRIYCLTGESPSSTDRSSKVAKRPLRDACWVMRLLLSGPHPLYPAISPNKSMEGAVAGVIMNALCFAGLMHWFYTSVCDPPAAEIIHPSLQRVTLWLFLGAIMGVLGVCGDLLQSLLKRAARVKDAGFIIPGHGGMLDRVDGMLLVFPFVYCTLRVLIRLSDPSGARHRSFFPG